MNSGVRIELHQLMPIFSAPMAELQWLSCWEHMHLTGIQKVQVEILAESHACMFFLHPLVVNTCCICTGVQDLFVHHVLDWFWFPKYTSSLLQRLSLKLPKLITLSSSITLVSGTPCCYSSTLWKATLVVIAVYHMFMWRSKFPVVRYVMHVEANVQVGRISVVLLPRFHKICTLSSCNYTCTVLLISSENINFAAMLYDVQQWNIVHVINCTKQRGWLITVQGLPLGGVVQCRNTKCKNYYTYNYIYVSPNSRLCLVHRHWRHYF